jgi:hypothetical protein
MRRALGALKSIADRTGLGVPAVVKTQLRRIF